MINTQEQKRKLLFYSKEKCFSEFVVEKQLKTDISDTVDVVN